MDGQACFCCVLPAVLPALWEGIESRGGNGVQELPALDCLPAYFEQEVTAPRARGAAPQPRTQMRVARRISYIMHRAALGRGVCTLQCAYVLYTVCGTYPY